MSPFYCVRYIDGIYMPGYTTNGIDFYPIPRAANQLPRPAIRYADMRQSDVQPLREEAERLSPTGLPLPGASEPLPATGRNSRPPHAGGTDMGWAE